MIIMNEELKKNFNKAYKDFVKISADIKLSLNGVAKCKADKDYNAIVDKITNKLDSLDDTCSWLAKITVDIEEYVMSPLIGRAISEEWKSIAHNWERTCRETDEKYCKLLNENDTLKKRICDLEKNGADNKEMDSGKSDMQNWQDTVG